jgi:hypothetical protein
MKREALTKAHETQADLLEQLLELIGETPRAEVAKRIGVKVRVLEQWLSLDRFTVLHAARIAQGLGLRIRFDFEQACWKCGCTQNDACEGGCSWVEEDLCSACA